jgi:thiamine biosynthesis lipoprotein
MFSGGIPVFAGAALCRDIRSERSLRGIKPLLRTAFAAGVIAGGSTRAAEAVALSGRAMGTTWSVKFEQVEPRLDAVHIQAEVAKRLEQLEQQFSTYRPQSTVSRFNAARHTDWFAVGPELARVAEESRHISALTGGAFDATVHPLVQLWGFGGGLRPETLPTPAEIAAARERVGWTQLEARADPPALRKAHPRVAVDFSSMAKGFAADALSDLLAGLGAPNHLVQVGGDVKSGGLTADGAGWRVGIEEPVDGARAGGIACVIVLRGEGLSTSGNYRNTFTIDGERVGHFIDPRRGRPVSGTLAAVSVVDPSCAKSSAWATALFVLGADEGYRLAREHRLACLFQVRNGTKIERRMTPEFERMMAERVGAKDRITLRP